MDIKDYFFIGIPTINRADLLIDALNRYVWDFPNIKIFIIDNGNQPELTQWVADYHQIENKKSEIELIRTGKNEGVAESWNIILKAGFSQGLKWGLIMNDDIYLGKTQTDILDVINELHDYVFICTIPVFNWCVFLISKQVFEIVGDFDKGFYPAYFEDNDYRYRIQLLRISIHSTNKLNPIIYRNSMSINKDNTLNSRFGANQTRYVDKWGGMPMNEKFTKPFNK